MTRGRQYATAGIAILAGVLLRLYCIHTYPHIMGDALSYGDLARNLVLHHTFGFSDDGGLRLTLIRLPGYPLLMAACFAVFGVGNYTSVLLLQLVIDLGSCCLIAALAFRLFGARIALFALWLGALCPFLADYVAAGYTETVAMFCAALGFYSLERWARSSHPGRWLLPLALSLAYACLLRPDRALLAVAIVGAMAWISFHSGHRRQRFTHILAVCLVILTPLAVWTARNWHAFHVIQPLAPRYANDPGERVNYGFQRWYKTWAIDAKSNEDIYWNFDDSPMLIADLPPRAFDSAAQRIRTEALFDEYDENNSATPELDARFGALAAERIRQHPLRYYIGLPLARTADMWLRPRTELRNLPLDWWSLRNAQCLQAAALGLLNLACLGLAIVGLWLWRRARWSGIPALAGALVGFVLLRSALLLTMDNSEPRYTMDCYPVVLLLASFAFARHAGADAP